jgi:1,4-alpha-glucan branching enzyme
LDAAIRPASVSSSSPDIRAAHGPRVSTARRSRARRPAPGRAADWGTLIFNYGRNEVRNFAVERAAWFEEHHVDGVDAVASMLYPDYSAGRQWIPNRSAGANLEAISFRSAEQPHARRHPAR